MNISAFPKEVIQQVVKIIQDIVARLSGYPWFLFGIIPMLFAVVALIFLTFTTAPPFLVQLVPFALLVFGLLVIGAHAFVPRRGKDIQEIMDENLSQEQVKERISRIADFDWTVVEPRVKHWAEHQGAINHTI